MPKAKIFHRIGHRAEHMLAMVADVALYPDFIPLISQVRLLNPSSPAQGQRRFEADVIISYKLLTETFRSEVNIYTERKMIEVKKPSRSGAVKRLSNRWLFHSLSDETTLVEFDVDVGLQNFILDQLVTNRFGKARDYIMTLFENRADRLFERLECQDIDLRSEYENLGLSHYFI